MKRNIKITFAIGVAFLTASCCMLGAARRLDAADPLQNLLSVTSRQVTAYLELISQVNCSEHVIQLKLSQSGKIQEKKEMSYDYLILLSNASGVLNLVESRIAANPGRKDRKVSAPLLLSNGFSTLFLIFHPYYSFGFEFRITGEEMLSGRTFTKVHFSHIPGTRSPAALAVREREYPLDLSGTAWIDPQSGIIAKIVARLETNMEDVGLRNLQSEVEYAPVSFQGVSKVYWLPAQASVDVKSKHQHWRNTYIFSAYRRFSVRTQEQISKP